jgi:hypothetical protein
MAAAGVGEIWEDCEDDFVTSKDECDLAVRFPGLWPHVMVNFAYRATAAACCSGWRLR